MLHSTMQRLQLCKAGSSTLQTVTGIPLTPQGGVWLQNHTWTVQIIRPPLPALHLLFTIPILRDGQILLPQVITSIRGSQINIRHDASSLQEPHAGELLKVEVGRGAGSKMSSGERSWYLPALHAVSCCEVSCLGTRQPGNSQSALILPRPASSEDQIDMYTSKLLAWRFHTLHAPLDNPAPRLPACACCT